MTKVNDVISEKLAAAFPAGAMAGALEFLTGQSLGDVTEVYHWIQREDKSLDQERRSLSDTVDLMRRALDEETRAYAPVESWLAGSHATSSMAADILGQKIVRELAHNRIIRDIEARTSEAMRRRDELDERSKPLSAIVGLAHVRAGNAEMSEALAGQFGLSRDEMMTDAERWRFNEARRAEAEAAEERRLRDAELHEEAVRIAKHREKEEAMRAARDAAEVELVDEMTIPQMIRLIRLLFEESEPPPDLMLVVYGQFDGLAQKRALVDLENRSRWTSYGAAKRRACERLIELVKDAKYGREMTA